MKKLLLIASIVLGSVSVASAQSATAADIDPAAAKPATALKPATTPDAKKQKADAAANASAKANAKNNPLLGAAASTSQKPAAKTKKFRATAKKD